MPRKARVILPNTPHHIVQRGHNRDVVFVEESDYHHYLATLAEWKLELDIKVYAWCLMTNHVHLILDPCENRLAIGLLMKRLAGRQTRYVNKQERRTGSLWEGRYKASAIQTESYFLQCCRYVELNPVKAGMVSSAEHYRWSSYRVRLGMDASLLLDQARVECSGEDYQKYLELGIPPKEQQFIQERIQRNALTGSSAFEDEIEQRLGIRILARAPGRPKGKK